MARVNLTAGRVRGFALPEGKAQAFLWDSTVPGLGVRATATVKAFVFQGRLDGRTLRVTIGDVRSWDIDKAQAEARRLQQSVDAGTDPRQEKAERLAQAEHKRQEASRQELAFADAWEAYLQDRRPAWSEHSYLDHVKMARPSGPLAPLLGLELRELTADTVRAWLKREAARRPTQAALAFRLLRAFANWCSDRGGYRGIVDPQACASRIARQELPKRGVKADVLQREQLALWFEAVRKLGNPVVSAYLQALLLTGARREELALLAWDRVDFQWGSLTIRDKVQSERTIPLCPYTAHLLAALPRRNAWVFSSPAAKGGRLTSPTSAHDRALLGGGLPHLTLHGLRRSFGTLAEWVELPAGVVAQIMGHKPSATAERHYRVRPLDLLRMWHTKLEAWILQEAGIHFEPEQAAGLRVVGRQ